MKILLMHPNFPAQFLNLCLVLGPHPDFEIVYMTARKEGELQGVRKVYFEPSRVSHPELHPYLNSVESAVLQGQAVYKSALELKKVWIYSRCNSGAFRLGFNSLHEGPISASSFNWVF